MGVREDAPMRQVLGDVHRINGLMHVRLSCGHTNVRAEHDRRSARQCFQCYWEARKPRPQAELDREEVESHGFPPGIDYEALIMGDGEDYYGD